MRQVPPPFLHCISSRPGFSQNIGATIKVKMIIDSAKIYPEGVSLGAGTAIPTRKKSYGGTQLSGGSGATLAQGR